MGETIHLIAGDGFKLSAWCARPTGKPRGGVVVLQEIFGVNDHIRSVADTYAAEGYLAIAPALFDRVETGVEVGYDKAGMNKGRNCVARLEIEDVLLDVSAAVHAASEAGKVGIVGYCWGGSLAWAAACRVQGLAAASGYYGARVHEWSNEKPMAPAILHFGAKDAHIPLSGVDEVAVRHPDVPVHVYDADHGFNCDARASYDKAAADLARQRTLELFARHVG